MKKIFLVLMSAVSASVFAQSSILLTTNGNTFAPSSIIFTTTTPNGNTKIDVDIKNTSASTQTYTVKRYDIQLNAVGNTTADAYFCFAGNCYPDFTMVSPNTLVLNSGQSTAQSTVAYTKITADLDEASAVGLSIVKYTVINTNTATPGDTVQFTIKYNAPAGISEVSGIVSSFELWPNPVNDVATVKVQSTRAAEGKLVIHNALGAVIYERQVSITEGKNKIDLNAEGFSTGIYFASLKFGNSSVTRKFVVK
jgi:hypothetical protein